MSKSFSVRVIRSDGQPRQGVRVSADYGLLDGVASAYTGNDGWVNLFLPTNAAPEIYVDGKSLGRHSVSDGKTLSFKVDYR